VPDIRAELLTRGLVAEISGTTIWRWLATDAIRPWTYRSWIFPRDPDFAGPHDTQVPLVLGGHIRRSQAARPRLAQ
jgi:hypothetical protein